MMFRLLTTLAGHILNLAGKFAPADESNDDFWGEVLPLCKPEYTINAVGSKELN